MANAVLTDEELAVFEFGRAFGAAEMPSAQQMAKTVGDLANVQGLALIVGGLAVMHHGYRRSTQDVDLLYSCMDGGIPDRLEPYFELVQKGESGWYHLVHRETRVRLKLIPEGGRKTHGMIPAPATVGGEKGFISLWGLLWLKLLSGRVQDDADVVELMKARMDDVASVRGKLPPELQEGFDKFLARAKQELENDPNLNPEKGGPDPNWLRAQEEAAKYGARKKGRRKAR